MALKKCKECGSQVSTDAKRCPQCGAKVKKPIGFLGMIALGLMVIGISKCVMDQSNRPQQAAKTPEQIERDAKNEAEFQADVAKVRALRSAMKNPASFELVSAIRMDNGVLCVSYRATNSFNAVITESKAITPAGEFADWNKVCAGKTGKDVTYLRRAL